MIIEIISLLSVLAAAVCYNIFIMAIAREIVESPNIVSVNEYVQSILFNVAICCSLIFSIMQVCVGEGTLFSSSVRGFICNITFIFTHVLAAVWGWAFSSGNNVVSFGLTAGMFVTGLISYLAAVASRLPIERSHLKNMSPRSLFLFRHFLCSGMIGTMWSWTTFCLQLSLTSWLQSTNPPNCTNSTILAVVPPAIVACVCILSGDFISLIIPCAFVAVQYITTRPTTINCSDRIDTSYLSSLFVLGFELIATIISIVGRAKRKEGKKSRKKASQEDILSGKAVDGAAINLDPNSLAVMPLSNTLRLEGLGLDHTLKLPGMEGGDVFDKYKLNNNEINGTVHSPDEGDGDIWEEDFEEEGEYEYEYEYEEEYEENGEGNTGRPTVAPQVIREEKGVSDNNIADSLKMGQLIEEKSFDESVVEVVPVKEHKDVLKISPGFSKEGNRELKP